MSSNDNMRVARVCPRCGRTYTEYPALSRVDNETAICPDCGTKEALDSLGISLEEQSEIIGKIHEFKAEKR
jgi:DNA-directed RNA polymerase subunit RPC12/RpoP